MGIAHLIFLLTRILRLERKRVVRRHGLKYEIDLGEAIDRFVRPAMSIYLGITHIIPYAAAYELARRFRGRDAGFELITLGAVNHVIVLVHGNLLKKIITTYSGDIFPAPAPNRVFQQAYVSGKVEVENWSVLTLPLRLMAGGMGFMLSCDIVYAREGIKFGTPEVNVGLFPMMIGALIFRNAPRKKALEMIYTARTLTPQEAEEMGLITRAVPAEELDNVVNEALESISAKAPLAVEMGRKALATAEDMSLPDALDYLSGQLCEVVATEDAKEGLMAFMQKRQPEWKRA